MHLVHVLVIMCCLVSLILAGSIDETQFKDMLVEDWNAVPYEDGVNLGVGLILINFMGTCAKNILLQR